MSSQLDQIRKGILGAKDRKTVKVETPEWPCGHVHVRSLTPREKIELHAKVKESKDSAEPYHVALGCCYSICDEEGNRIFQDEDLEALMDKNAVVLDRVFIAAMELSVPSTVKALEKNSRLPRASACI